MTAPIVEVSGLTVADRTGQRVLDAISLRLPEGASIGVLGESGSGKTTIARCIAGLHLPEQGTIALTGDTLHRDVRRRTIDQRRRIQLIPQDPLGSAASASRPPSPTCSPTRSIPRLASSWAPHRHCALSSPPGARALSRARIPLPRGN